MKELENGKKKLLITGMILIIIAVCTAGIFAYGSHKNNQKAAAKVQEESVQRASQEQSANLPGSPPPVSGDLRCTNSRALRAAWRA